ncbi:MAG: SGNH/GDSL hydrolase family protein [Reyranellales bacterium]
MTRWLLGHVGLVRPYRFERTLCALTAALLAIAVAAAALGLYLAGKLASGTPREWYFLYMAGLVVLGFALAPIPRAAAVVLSLAALEVGFGLGSGALSKVGLTAASLMPSDHPFESRFEWHPLLQAVPKPRAADPDAAVPTMHNSAKLRGPERPAGALDGRTVIAVFGGSTTYDIAARDGESWPDRLEQLLGEERFAVLNHGVPGYTTVEAVLQTAFYQAPFGVAPRCATYFVGWNDLRDNQVTDIDPGFADFDIPARIDDLQARRIGGPYLAASPTATYLGRLAVLAFDTARPPPPLEDTVGEALNPAFAAIYVRNLHAISAINRERGIRTIWIGQLVNRELLMKEGTDDWFPFHRDSNLLSMIERLNGIVRREAAVLGDLYIEAPADEFEPDDFHGSVHFQPGGSLRFAAYLAPFVAEACR